MAARPNRNCVRSQFYQLVLVSSACLGRRFAGWQRRQAVVRRLQAVSLHCDVTHVSDDVLAEARANGIPVLCYTVNTKDAAKSLFERGVSAIFTDHLDLFVAETSAYKGLHLRG